MSEVNQMNGDVSVSEARIAIVVGRFNGFIVESLLQGALDTLARSGIPSADITVSHVPGALEMPLVVQKFAQSGKYDAIIGLGAVILILWPAKMPRLYHRWHCSIPFR